MYINVLLQNLRVLFQCIGGNYRGMMESKELEDRSQRIIGEVGTGNRTSEGLMGRKL